MERSTHGQRVERITPILNQTFLDQESARYVAKSLFQMYDTTNKGYIDESEAKTMITDAYTNVNQLYIPKENEA